MSRSPLISDHHRVLYQQHYDMHPIKGPRRPSIWINRIENEARRFEARSIIDYGCGAARGVSCCSTLPVADYDPGVPGLENVPEPADLVVSIHMLEHVEEDKIDAVVEHIRSLALKAALIVVSCEHSTKLLPDGTPWHSFVRPYWWWAGKLGGELIQTIKDPEREFATVLRADYTLRRT
jgi:hypothetical protein